MLEDFAITPASVRCSVPCGNQSLIGLSSRWSCGRYDDLGARRHQALVEQRARGEHLLDRARLVDVLHGAGAEVVLGRRRSGRWRRTSGSRPARAARRSAASMTTAKPESPPASSTVWRSTRWAYHCRSRSMRGLQVLAVDRPWSRCSRRAGSGCRRRPRSGRSRRCRRAWSSKVRSKPASGSSVPTKPTRLAATSPAG